jgi:prophage regulatory protein
MDETAQFELPFAIETEIISHAAQADLKPEPPPPPAAGNIRGSRNFKTPVRPDTKRINQNRKPPAKEILAPNGIPLRNPKEPSGEVEFMRLPGVKAVTGLGKTSIYELIRDKSFPAPVRLGPRAVAWVKSEVRQWALARVHASRSVA